MKEKILLIVFFINVNLSFGQITELKDTIKGNVESFKETWFEAKYSSKGFQKTNYLHDDEFFKNENNIFVKKTIFPLEKYETPQNEYNSKNQVINTINYYEDGKIINKTTYLYLNDLLVEENFYLSSDKIQTKKTYEYKNGKKSNIIEYLWDENENIFIKFSTTTYSYDIINQISENIDYEKQDDWLYQYKYNNKNFLTEIHFAEYKKNEIPKLKLKKKILYVSDDGINWLSAFFIDEYDENIFTKPIKIFYIEREINYKK